MVCLTPSTNKETLFAELLVPAMVVRTKFKPFDSLVREKQPFRQPLVLRST